MGIEPADFLIAGGLILLVLSIRELATGKMVETEPRLGTELVGVVPIGTPLVVGPAVLTTILVLTEQRYVGAVVLAFVINLGITYAIFSQANRVAGFLGEGGLRAVAKIAALLLAAIAVKMMHEGIIQIIAAMGS
jgi:multiple antibiotic resistance protein